MIGRIGWVEFVVKWIGDFGMEDKVRVLYRVILDVWGFNKMLLCGWEDFVRNEDDRKRSGMGF